MINADNDYDEMVDMEPMKKHIKVTKTSSQQGPFGMTTRSTETPFDIASCVICQKKKNKGDFTLHAIKS